MKIALLLILSLGHALAEAPKPRKVLITIDDLPGWYKAPINVLLMRSLRAKLGPMTSKVVFFVNGGKITSKEESDGIKAFTAAGARLANHGAAHVGYRTLTEEQFRRNVEAGKRALGPFGAKNVLPLFRYPDLDYGDTPRKAEAGAAALKALGLRDLPAAIDASDWAFEKDYLRALMAEDYVTALKVKEGFIAAFKEALISQDAANEKIHGALFPQVIMFHLTHVLVDAWEPVTSALGHQGFEVAAVDEVLHHGAYAGLVPCAGKPMMLWKDLKACSQRSGRK